MKKDSPIFVNPDIENSVDPVIEGISTSAKGIMMDPVKHGHRDTRQERINSNLWNGNKKITDSFEKCPQCGNPIPSGSIFELGKLPEVDSNVNKEYIDDSIRDMKFCSPECVDNAFYYGPKSFNELEKFLYALRQANPVVTLALFLNGQCGQLFNIIKCVFPDAEAYTDDCIPHPAHQYIKWKGNYYDITGKIDPLKLKDIPINRAEKHATFLPSDDRYIQNVKFNKPELYWQERLRDPEFYREQYKSAQEMQRQ